MGSKRGSPLKENGGHLIGAGSVAAGQERQEKEEEEEECAYQVGYRLSYLKLALLLPPALLPLPFGLLVAYWFRHLALRLVAWHSPLHKAHYVIVKDVDGKCRVERVRHLSLPLPSSHCGDTEDELTPILGVTRERQLAYFKHRHIIYLYEEAEGRFLRLSQWERGRSFDTLHDHSMGLSSDEHRASLTLNGRNEVNVPVKPLYALFMDEALHPFYVFEVVTVAFWMADTYYYYSGCILLIQAISIAISMVQTRREEKHLHNMVMHSSLVTVIRQGAEQHNVSSSSLVPGDVLVVPPGGMVCPCDMALLSGSAIVNESMLTGESVPVTKTALPRGAELYDVTRHKKHTLFGGTEVIQTRYYKSQRVLAVVVSTSFWTAKGTLVRSILFPKPLNVKLWKDAIKFVLALAVIAFAGVAYSLAINLYHGYNVRETMFRSLDVVTILVAPALPAALTVGTIYAIARLKKKKIHCTSPQRVSLCGQVDVACFDKTGTLTEDSLDLLGVKPCGPIGSHPFTNGGSIQDSSAVFSSTVVAPGDQLSVESRLLQGMACCHSLTLIGGEVRGDPLDCRMFQATKWVLEEPGEESSNYDILVPAVVHPPASETQPVVELAIMKQFTFSSELQRMSVLVRRLPLGEDPELGTSPHRTDVFVKGAPETIQQLCVKGSVPDDFGAVLQGFTLQGYRVLALAHKVMDLPWHRMDHTDRSLVEDGLSLLGLLVLQNTLKPVTAPVIRELWQAALRTVMVTGDNMLTAVCVARECGMVGSGDELVAMEATVDSSGCTRVLYHSVGEAVADLVCSIQCHKSSSKVELQAAAACSPVTRAVVVEPRVHLAVDGPSFAVILQHRPELLPRLLVRGTVFARMSPPQKQQLVERLQGIGYNVAMCGDGANDCGALKAAVMGISLSAAEASIAAPFTSARQDIRCVPTVIKEGRASLVTSFSLFKFMALYSIAEFVTVAVLYSIESNLGDFQYLFVDLILALALAFGMGYSGPARSLALKRPPCTLVGPLFISQLLVHITLIAAFQLTVWFYLRTTHWFQPLVPDPDSDNIWSYENAAMFLFSNFQYLTLALVLSSGPPYRQPTYCNLYLMVATLILLPLCVLLALAPAEWMLQQPLRLLQVQQSPSWTFKLALVEIALVNFLLAYIVQAYVLETLCYRRLVEGVWRRLRKERAQSEYERISKALENDTAWPPLVDTSE